MALLWWLAPGGTRHCCSHTDCACCRCMPRCIRLRAVGVVSCTVDVCLPFSMMTALPSKPFSFVLASALFCLLFFVATPHSLKLVFRAWDALAPLSFTVHKIPVRPTNWVLIWDTTLLTECWCSTLVKRDTPITRFPIQWHSAIVARRGASIFGGCLRLVYALWRWFFRSDLV